ncbi:hypothetical protein C8Q77DRAFT_141887 [Trametes polyzona]|nr:hypothetical protein C8Q77DRAFT_141887 [Trametes polyzona]
MSAPQSAASAWHPLSSHPRPAKEPSPPPTPETKYVPLADMRQLTLESGRIIDLPISILRDPPPKPTEFLHLQHYFEGRRGEPVDLDACKSAEEAVGVLADEIEAIRLLLHGYVLNFRRYVDRFEKAHEELRKEVLSVAESYDGLARIAGPAQQSAKTVEDQFFELKKKIAALPVGGTTRPPPKILRGNRGALMNPPMSDEENKTISARNGARFEERIAMNQVRDSEHKLADAAIVKELVDPAPAPKPAPAPTKKAKKSRKKTPLTQELRVKVEKVVENVEAAREQLLVAQAVTAQDLAVLRLHDADAKKDANELWAWYDVAERWAVTAGKVSSLNQRRIEAYDKWATKCAEDAAASGHAAAGPASDPSKEAKEPAAASDEPESPCRPRSQSDGDDESAAPTAPAPTIAAPPTDGDVYAVTLELSCAKPFDELTREEAIEVLKSLPVCVNIMPYIAPEPEDMDVDEAAADGEGAQEPACPSPSQKAAAQAAVPDPISPSASERERCAPKPKPKPKSKSKSTKQSKKRSRDEEDEDEEADVADDGADPRPEAGGSPIKKKRGGDA